MTERSGQPPRATDDWTWFDRLVGLFEGRRLPWWALLLLVYVALAALMTVTFWIDGSLPVGTIGHPAVDAFYPAFGLLILLSVRRGAHRALDRFAPALRGVDASTIDAYQRRLTGLTNRHLAFGLLIGVAIGAIVVASSGDPSRLGATPFSTTVYVVISTVLGYGLGITGVVFIISVLATIPEVHRAATEIDVRRPDPAHAFATLTAQAGVLLLILVTFSAATDPSTFQAASLGLSVAVIVIAVVAFLAPLLGMRQVLSRHKAALLEQSLGRIEAVEADLERTVDAGDTDRISPLTEALGTFYARHDRLARASTMPWDDATVRGFASALLIPVATWLATSVLGRTLGV